MFQECNELIHLDLSNFNTLKVSDMSYLFYNCKKLEYLNISNFTINNKVETKNIFYGLKKECKIINKDNNLKNLDNSFY